MGGGATTSPPQRAVALQILAASEGHHSVEQVCKLVKKDFPMTSLATVCSTVALLKGMGEILELDFNDVSDRFPVPREAPEMGSVD